jgi:uncharacterized membrane protein
MLIFAIALIFFIFIHVGLSATGLRAKAVAAMGEGAYRGMFALASIAGLAFLIWTYGVARYSPGNLPLAPGMAVWGAHAAHGLMLASLLLIVPGLLTPGPTQMGFEATIAKPEPATGILRVTRHPFLWGVVLWGAAHLFANSEPTSIALFGGLGVMCVLGARSIDRKTAARTPEHWARFSAVTSNVPFAAIAQGRNRFNLAEIWWKLLVALAAYAALAYFHGPLIGVRAFTWGA